MPINKDLKMNNDAQIRKIKLEILAVWDRQEHKGFKRLATAYAFFVAMDDCGQMVFSPHCVHTEEMRLGDDGKTHFNKFVADGLDLTNDLIRYEFEADFSSKAELLANQYVEEQASRLASFIVRILTLEITE